MKFLNYENCDKIIKDELGGCFSGDGRERMEWPGDGESGMKMDGGFG